MPEACYLEQKAQKELEHWLVNGSDSLFPYYHLVPKDPIENLRWRRVLNKLGHQSQEMREAIWIACKRDFLFFVNSFLVLHEARGENDAKEIPFITFGVQDDVARQLVGNFGKRSFQIAKSRDMGASYMVVALFFWRWLFYRSESFLMISRNEEYVDSEDSKSLFFKIDVFMEYLPTWMNPNPRIIRKKMLLKNLDNNSVIVGETTTPNSGRGDRKTAILLDEAAAFDPNLAQRIAASVQKTSNMRIWNSTPQGFGGTFQKLWDKPEAGIKIRMHWSDHPFQKPGLYQGWPGKLEILDKKYVFPEGYKFRLDGKLRSPYYDLQEDEAPAVWVVAQELDIDFSGGENPFFPPDLINRLRSEEHGVVQRPMAIGELLFEPDSLEPIQFVPQGGGCLRLYVPLVAGTPDPTDSYVIGSDIATGTGASNSASIVVSRRTRRVVATLVSPYMTPEDFTFASVALAKWFNNAFMIWEANGNGAIFTKKVLQSKYTNFFYRDRAAKEDQRNKRPSKAPGWWKNEQTALKGFSALREAMKNRWVDITEKEILDECLAYIYVGRWVKHRAETQEADASGAGDNHGDRVIGMVLAFLAIERDVIKTRTAKDPLAGTLYGVAVPAKVPKDCMGARLMKERDEDKTGNDGYVWEE